LVTRRRLMEIGWIDTPEDWTMIFIMAYCAAGVMVFLVATVLAIVTGFLSVSTVNSTRRVVTTNLGPALENVRDTTSTVKGTVSFVSDNAVKPIVRAYATYAGARRFVTVMARFTRRRGQGV
jgi:hypothetical protein